MGRPTIDSESTPISHSEASSISHFSHLHPLQLLNHQTLLGLSHVSCSCCNLEAPDSMFGCLGCNYFLHKKCSELPSRITHPFDQHHEFTLLPRPKYIEGHFICDGCGKNGRGFCYHCEACGKDLHTQCACLPMILAHHSHQHQLSLTFSPPYPGKTFHCDLCKKSGSKYWLYRCGSCEFDVHLSCVTMIATNPAPEPVPLPFPAGMVNNNANPTTAFGLQQQQQQYYHQQQQYYHQQPVQNPMMQNFLHNPTPGFHGGFRPTGAGHAYQAQPMIRPMVQQQPNALMNSFVEGAAGGVAQALTTAVIQEFVGGNGGGNDAAGGGGSSIGFGGADSTAYDESSGGADSGGGGDGSY